MKRPFRQVGLGIDNGWLLFTPNRLANEEISRFVSAFMLSPDVFQQGRGQRDWRLSWIGMWLQSNPCVSIGGGTDTYWDVR